MHVVVKKWGNSASVRLPTAVMQAAHLRLDQPVDVRVEDGRVIIEPVEPETFELSALLAGITDDNRHDPIEFGDAVGREIW
jgi:antitoxin MazE